MIVECPRCNARYRVDDGVIADEPTFKCSRCSHFFGQEAVAVVAAAKQSKAAADASAATEEPIGEDEDAEATPEPVSPPSPSRRPVTRGGGRGDAESLSLPFGAAPPSEVSSSSVAVEPVVDDVDDDFSLDSDEEDSSEAFAIGANDETDGPQPRFARTYEEAPPGRSADRTRRPYLIFVGVVLLVFGNLALYLRNHPDAAERFLARIPFAGRILIENRLLQSRVYLRDIEGVYQQIKDGRTVFIVSGRAINTAEAPLKGVEIESALYDAAGAVLIAKSIYCGNAMSLKIVKDLSSKEISILQRLQPPQRFEIAPGEAAGFSVVFLDPPSGFKEFSARVTAAQPSLS